MFDYLVWLLRRILVLTQTYLKCKICSFWLGQLRRVRRLINIGSVKTLVHAFVTSRVDYCNSFLSFAPKKATDKLQHVQDAATRLVTGTWKYERGLSRLMHDDLHWLVIPQRVQYMLAVTVHRCLRHRAPRFLSCRLLCASLWSFWSPAPAICQMSSTVTSATSPQHLWDSYTFCRRTKSLEFTAWLSAVDPEQFWARPEDVPTASSLDSRSVSALEVLRNRALQSEIYLLTCLLTTQYA